MADTPAAPEKKKSNKITVKQRVILLVTCPLIIILLSSIAIVTTVRKLEAGELKEDSEEQQDVIRELPEEFNSDASAYFEGLLKEAAAATDVKIGTGIGVSIHDMSGDFSPEAFKMINHVTGQFSDGVKAKYSTSSVKYGESAAMLNDVAKIVGKIGEATGEGKNDDFSYTLNIPVDADTISAFTEEDAKIYEESKKECADFIRFTEDSFVLDSVTAYVRCSYEKNCMNSIELVREYKVDMQTEFIGCLDVFGSGALSFGCRISTKFDIVHAGISVQDELTLTKNGFQTLSMSANVGDDALSAEDAESEGVTDPDRIFTVEFISSDESVATVDKTGMVQAESISDKPVTVTVKLTYHGKEYTDTCTVRVIEDED